MISTHMLFPLLSAARDLAMVLISLGPGSPCRFHPGQARRLILLAGVPRALHYGSFGMVSRSDSQVTCSRRSEGGSGAFWLDLWVLKLPGRRAQSPFAAQGGPLALQGRRRLRWAGDRELVGGGNWADSDGRCTNRLQGTVNLRSPLPVRVTD